MMNRELQRRPGLARMAWYVSVLLSLAAPLGCVEENISQDGPVAVAEQRLVDNLLWVALEPSDDPFLELASQPVVCPSEAHAPDPEIGDVWYTVETRLCNYLSVAQPLKYSVPAGAMLHMRVYQSVQVSGTGFRLGLAFNDTIAVREEFGGAPVGSGTRLVTWNATEDIPAGTRVVWNVSNDGVNSWSLITLTSTVPAPAASEM